MLNVTYHIGTITSDPIISSDHKGRPVASFAIVSTREYYNSSDEKRVEILDAKVQAFGKLASSIQERAKLFSLVLIRGRLANESSVNKNIVITAEHIDFSLPEVFARDIAKNLNQTT